MVTIDTLNEQFAATAGVEFYAGKGGLTILSIKNKLATAEIALHGAQILSYIPVEKKEVLWMSQNSLFTEGKAIRGGIPICFPWFGPHPADKKKPQHGFARLQEWNVNSIVTNNKGVTLVSLFLTDSPSTLQLWPFPFTATLEFSIGDMLEVKLTVTNTSNQSFDYSAALHSYFNISDIKVISLEGFHEATYYDGFEMDLKVQDGGTLHFDEATETNRRYVNHLADCVINDPGYNRKIMVAKAGSKVTVVWNPGKTVANTMSDITPGGYQKFVCAEPANAYPDIDIIKLAPGETHSLSTTISIVQ